MQTPIPRYWQHRIDGFRDDLKWALAEDDSQALLAQFTRLQSLHSTCADEYQQAVKTAILHTFWQVLETASSTLSAGNEQPH